MTRDAFGDRLLDLAYGELSGREARAVEAHAASCEACRAELARIRETRRLMSALPDEAPAADGERILLAAARQVADARTPRRRLAPWLWGATAAAFSLVAVAAVSYRIMAMRPGPLEPPDSDALLGGSYASPPPPAAPAPGEAPRREEAVRPRGAEAEAPAAAERAPATRALRKSAEARGEERSASAGRAERDAPVEAPPSDAEPERAAAAPPEPVAGAEAFDAPPPRSAHAPAEPPAAASGAKRAAPTAARAPAEAAPAPSAAAANEALRHRAALRDEGSPRAEVRTFPGCEGETLRRVERDPQGRLLRYVREGRIDGRHLRIEHVYRPDGALAGATVRDLDASGALLDADALGLELPSRAEEAGIDAPPRCGR
jgi:hypothetical protein